MPRPDVVVISNPVARAAPPKVVAAITAAWRTYGSVEHWPTEGRGHGITLAQQAAEAGARVAVAVGGDGTVNEVANGVAGSDTALAAVPGGSTNVFARALGLPRDALAATKTLLDAARAERRAAIGAGRLDGRLFLANAGAGFDAAVLVDVEAHPRLKRSLGPLWFAAATARLTMRPRLRAAEAVRVQADGAERVAQFVAVLHTGPYSYLGSRRLLLADGPPLRPGLTLVALDRLGPRELALRLPRALGRGLDRAAADDLWVEREVDEVRLERQHPGQFVYQVDGELCVTTERLQLNYQPDALVVVDPSTAPTTSSWR